jgi:hypothetical protein
MLVNGKTYSQHQDYELSQRSDEIDAGKKN